MFKTRSKEEGSLSANSAIWTENITPRGSASPLPDKTYSYLSDISYYSHVGESVPHFHKRKKAGELLPITNWTQTSIAGSTQGYTAVYNVNYYFRSSPNRDVTKGAWIVGADYLSQKAEDIGFHNLGPAYISMAAAKIYSSGFDGLTFLAELHKTVRMFRNFGKNLLSAARTGKLENSWLEGRYGWRVLVFEMFDLHETLCNLDLERKRWRESSGFTESTSNTYTNSWVGGYGTYYNTFTEEVKIGVRGTVVADLEPPKFQFNPITTSWELIPYSFVIDWFVNVGAWLSSLSFLVLQSQHYAAYGMDLTITRELVDNDLTPISNHFLESITGSGRCVAKQTLRVRHPVPILPSIRVRLDVGKVSDLVALVLQALRRK